MLFDLNLRRTNSPDNSVIRALPFLRRDGVVAREGASSRLSRAAFTAGGSSFGDEFVDDRLPAAGGFFDWLEAVAVVLGPEDLFEAVGDGEAGVGDAFGHDSLGPEVHGQVSPVVITVDQFVPDLLAFLLPRLVLRDESPERGEVDDHAVVQVGIPQRRDPLDLFDHRGQFGDELLLVFDLLALRPSRLGPRFAPQPIQLLPLVVQLRLDVFVQDLEEGVLGEAVVVEPDRVGCRRRRELPVDRSFATTLCVFH